MYNPNRPTRSAFTTDDAWLVAVIWTHQQMISITQQYSDTGQLALTNLKDKDF